MFLIEDHDEALKIWRQKGLKNLDLVHLDAHIDFGFYQAKPIEQVVNQARSLGELKRGLEYSLSFQRYESDFNKQINIGNYIYPAMQEGIINDFYWVVPGGIKEFKKSVKLIKNIIKNLSRHCRIRDSSPPPLCFAKRSSGAQNDAYLLEEGIISTELMGRRFVICILEKLPVLKQKVLLDIDTDFLVTDSLLDASNTAKIGKRERWIRPDRLIKDLLNKELEPALTTIAYSVNGGYTPMRYKILGDELAYRLSPEHFRERYGRKFIASVFFEHFEATGKKEDYQKAINLNPAYRAADNNYGPLYLSIRKFSQAEREFSRIAKADHKNPHPLIGLGNIALEKREFSKAKRYFSYAAKQKEDLPAALFGLAQANFRLKNFPAAKKLFLRYQSLQPLQAQSRYLLGRIYEKDESFEQAAACYQDAIRLGLSNIDIISRLLKISCYVKAKGDIIRYVFGRYKEFKRGYLRAKKFSLKKGKRAKGQREIENKMQSIEKRLGI